MKLSLNNKTPILTEEDEPSWRCPENCCFQGLYMGHSLRICNYFKEIQCTSEYRYVLKSTVHDIFKL